MANDTHTFVATLVVAHWFLSISLVYLNKVLMSSETVSFPAPLFVTWFQCVVTAAICWAAGAIAERFKSKADYQRVAKDEGESSAEGKQSFWSQFPRAEYKFGTARRVLPLSVLLVGMITFNNLCLKWVVVSFYTVARSLTIVFNAALSSVMLNSHSSTTTMVCLAVVILGFFMGSKGEVNFSMVGTISGVTASLFVALNSIYTKKVLPVVDNDHWRLTFYNNVNASIMFIPMILIFEHRPFAAAFGKQFSSSVFWAAMLVAGFFGFALGIVTVLQIKVTSPLSHHISGAAKAAVQSMLAFYIWGNEATFMGVLGIFVVLGGSLAYTIVKMGEGRAPPVEPLPSERDVEMPHSKSSQLNKE